MKDWLGYDYRPWPEVREWAQKQGLKSQKEFKNYCNAGKLPADIPRRPEAVYKDEWKSWGDFLGTGRIADQETGWSISKIKELLKHLIEGKVIYEWDEAVLYSLLLRRGLLNLDHKNRHFGFFKNLIEASRTEEGRKAIEEYANSDSETPPDLSTLSSVSEDDSEQEIQSASSQELC